MDEEGQALLWVLSFSCFPTSSETFFPLSEQGAFPPSQPASMTSYRIELMRFKALDQVVNKGNGSYREH